MTSVPGYGSMSGGTAPALIWHDFMATAVGKDCEDFPKPRQPFSPVPFFGKHSTTGSAPTSRPDYDPSLTGPGAPAPGTGGAEPDLPATPPSDGDGGGGGGEGYNPDLYESPPQRTPGGGGDDDGDEGGAQAPTG
jgi:penicillin-binding protein 1A